MAFEAFREVVFSCWSKVIQDDFAARIENFKNSNKMLNLYITLKLYFIILTISVNFRVSSIKQQYKDQILISVND